MNRNADIKDAVKNYLTWIEFQQTQPKEQGHTTWDPGKQQ